MAFKRPIRVAEFASDLRAALELRELSFARRFDAEFASNGGKLVYAVDSAILNSLFSSERSTDTSSNRGQRLGAAQDPYQVFTGPGAVRRMVQEAQADLRRTVLWYLLDGRTPTEARGYGPFLLMPGHSTEMRNLYDAIVWEFDQQRNRLGSLQEIAGRISELVADAGADRDSVLVRKELQTELAGLAFALQEPHAKFDRLNELLNRRQLMGLAIAASNDDFQSEVLRPNGQHVFRRQGPAREDGRVGSPSWWHNELHARLPARFAPMDREALVALDRINRSLDPAHARVVMFTDNREIIEAGRGYKPFKNDRDDDLANLTFSDLYLRHPSSLLVDPAFVRPGAPTTTGPLASGQDVDGWLRALLDETLLSASEPEGDEDNLEEGSVLPRWFAFRRHAPSLRNKLAEEERLRAALNNNPSLHEQFSKRWAEYLSHLTELYEANAPAVDDRIQALAGHFSGDNVKDVDQFVGEVREELRRLAERSWTTFFNTAADAGLELLDLPSPDAAVVWPVPPLFVQSDPIVAQVVRTFWAPKLVRQNPKAILQRLSDPGMRTTLQHSYLRALCYGLLFAHAERWPLTRLLAQRAMQISKEIKIEPEFDEAGRRLVSGREASFLLAVASRVTARSELHLQSAKSVLEDAIRANVDFADRVGQDESKLTGIRFEAEGIAVDAALATGAPQGHPIDDSTVKVLSSRIHRALKNTPDCSEPQVQLHTRIQLRSDYFSLLLLLRTPSRFDRSEEQKFAVGLSVMIHEQQIDLEELYGAVRNAPLRDLGMLRLAATSAGQLDALSNEIQFGSSQTHHAIITRATDRRLLMRIERATSART